MRVLAAFFFLLCSPTFCSISACRADTPPVSDIFVGNGTSGPFALRWDSIEANTERVSVNGQTQLRGLDYTIDSTAGTLTFLRNLPASVAVSVTYAIVPGVSRHIRGGQTIPLSIDLLRNRSGYFSLDALGKQAADAPSNLTLGLGLGWNGGGSSKFTSRFVYTPAMASGADSHADRTGISFGGVASAGSWGKFSIDFSRAGAGLNPSSGSEFQIGRQTLSLGSTLSPTKAIQAQLSFSRSDPMTGLGMDDAVTNSALALTVKPAETLTLSANIASVDRGQSGTTQTTALSVDAQPTKTLEVSAAFRDQNQPGTDSDSEATSLKIVLTPSKTYSVQTSADQSRLGTATTNRQSVSLSLTPKPSFQLQAGLSLRQTSAGGSPETLDTSAASIGGVVRPLPGFELSGTYKSRLAPLSDTNTNDLLDTSTARVAFAPFGAFRIVGTYAQNPDDGGEGLRHVARRGLGLETRFGAFGLSGGCDWSRAYGTPAVEQTIHADLGLRFSAVTQLSVGYQTQQNKLDPAAPLATAYTVGFTHTLGDRFSLSLGGKRQQSAVAAASPDYKATASLGMKF